MEGYAGKAIAVTGAGSGLGAAMAARFAAEGASVALLDIDGERAEVQAAELRAQGHEAYGERVDVADRASVEAAATAFGSDTAAVTVCARTSACSSSGRSTN